MVSEGNVRGPLRGLFKDFCGKLLDHQFKEDTDANFLREFDSLALFVYPFHRFPRLNRHADVGQRFGSQLAWVDQVALFNQLRS